MVTILEKVLARTSPVRQASRGQPYNYPHLWYGKPDGTITKLPGDPQNRVYYEDKGYTVLRDEEVREWENEVRPVVLEQQRAKAAIISTIRRMGAKHPGVEIVDNLDDLEMADLQEFLKELGQVTGAPVKIIAKKYGVEADREPADGALPVRSGAELEDALRRSEALMGDQTQAQAFARAGRPRR